MTILRSPPGGGAVSNCNKNSLQIADPQGVGRARPFRVKSPSSPVVTLPSPCRSLLRAEGQRHPPARSPRRRLGAVAMRATTLACRDPAGQRHMRPREQPRRCRTRSCPAESGAGHRLSHRFAIDRGRPDRIADRAAQIADRVVVAPKRTHRIEKGKAAHGLRRQASSGVLAQAVRMPLLTTSRADFRAGPRRRAAGRR